MTTTTTRQASLLRAIDAFTAEEHYSPSVEGLMEILEWSSKSVVQYHIEKALRAGLLSHVPNTARTLRLTTKGREAIGRAK